VKCPLISIVIPVYNEEESLPIVYERVSEVIDQLKGRYVFELLFMDNCSSDSTFEQVKRLKETDPRVRGIRYSKNFGYQRSIYMGYLKAKGAAIIQLDCDLQDPPEMIPDFLEKWEEGFSFVYGIRKERKESLFLSWTRRSFYRLINSLSEDDLPEDAGEFRLIDRRIVKILGEIGDHAPYLRGLIASLGFKRCGIPYARAARKYGETKFSVPELFRIAFDGIFSHSIIPLRLATWTGLLLSTLSIVALLFFMAAKLFFAKDWPEGFTTITILILFSLGVSSLFLGIIGEYLARIYKQVKTTPIAIVDEEI
jgi:polyisoprenyl-phosphate glycosyltransferase